MELFGGAGGDLAGVLGPVLRGGGYLTTLLATGAVTFGLVVTEHASQEATARRVAVQAAVGGAVVAAAAVPVQAAAVAGIGLGEAVTSARTLGDVLGSGFGQGTVLRVLGLAVVAVVWGVMARPPGAADLKRGLSSWPGAVVVMAAAAALWSHLLDGHQRVVEPVWLLLVADAVHLAAAAVWFGGAVLVALVVRNRPREADPVAVAGMVARFSSVALVALGAAVTAGGAMAWPLLGGLRELAVTSYGAVLVLKLGLVAVAAGIGHYNRRQLVPAVQARLAPVGGTTGDLPPEPPGPVPSSASPASARGDDAWRQLSRTLRVEALVLAGVLAVTGVLVTMPPAADGVGAVPFEATVALGPGALEADVVVEPARAGRNTLHVYVLDAQGVPAAEVADLRFELEYPPGDLGPIVVEPLFAGTGHWIATVDDLSVAGDWEVRVVAVVDAAERAASVTVPIVP